MRSLLDNGERSKAMTSAQTQIARLRKLGIRVRKQEYSGYVAEPIMYDSKYCPTVKDLKALADKLEQERK